MYSKTLPRALALLLLLAAAGCKQRDASPFIESANPPPPRNRDDGTAFSPQQTPTANSPIGSPRPPANEPPDSLQAQGGTAGGGSGGGGGAPGGPVPEPATYFLVGSGLAALAFARRRHARRSSEA
jgi:hypothetical protein